MIKVTPRQKAALYSQNRSHLLKTRGANVTTTELFIPQMNPIRLPLQDALKCPDGSGNVLQISKCSDVFTGISFVWVGLWSFRASPDY